MTKKLDTTTLLMLAAAVAVGVVVANMIDDKLEERKTQSFEYEED
jgi:hypothetical protein